MIALFTRWITLLRALPTLLERLERLEQLAVNQGRIQQAQHTVLKRWAAESAVLREIEDRAAKRLKREVANGREEAAQP